MSDKRRIITNTLANGIAQFTAMATALVFMPLLIRTFGVANYGLYMLASTIGGYASILDLGVGATLVKRVAEHTAKDERGPLGRFISTALSFYLVIGVIVGAGVAALAFFSGHAFHVTADQARLLRNMLLVIAASSLWSWPMATSGYVLAGLQRYTITARTALVVALGNLAAALIVVVFHDGPLTLLAINSVVGLAGGIWNTWAAFHEVGATAVSPRAADREVFRSILSFSWPIFVIQVSVLVIYQQTDRLLIGIFLGAAAIGLYEAAGKFQGLMVQLISFTNSAVMPMASQLQAEERSSALQTLFLRGSKYVSLLIYPVVTALLVLARPIIVHWLGPQFAGMTLAAQIFLSFQLFNAGTTVGDNMIVGLGRLKERLPNSVGIIAFGNLALSLLLIKPLGILGVVIGTAIPYFVDYPLHIRFLLRVMNVPFRRWVRETVAPVYPGLLVTLAVSLLAYLTPLVNSLLGLALVMLVAVVLYWITVFAFGLTDIEREEARHALARARDLMRAR